MRKDTIRIGTSGYIYPDWKDVFYPRQVHQERMLEYYAGHFSTVEFNSSYYRIPTYSQLKSLCAYVPEDFAFFLKAYRTLTHFTVEPVSPEQQYADLEQFRENMHGLGSHLRGVLFQFPYSFQYSPENLEVLGNIVMRFQGETTVVVEFRHRSWLNYEVSDFMKLHRLTYCAVDEPQLANMIPPIVRTWGEIGYVRLHGRNVVNWYGDSKLRYDYEYAREELEPWVDKIDLLSESSVMTYIFFNNCHLGKAVKNAKMMAEMLGLG